MIIEAIGRIEYQADLVRSCIRRPLTVQAVRPRRRGPAVARHFLQPRPPRPALRKPGVVEPYSLVNGDIATLLKQLSPQQV